MEEARNFWSEWLKSNEIKRLKLVESLPIMDLMMVRNPSMLNSYFEDLAYTLKPKKKKEKMLFGGQLPNASGKRRVRTKEINDVLKFLSKKLGFYEIEREMLVKEIFDELKIDYCFTYNGEIVWVKW
jgi:hypothetical protein